MYQLFYCTIISKKKSISYQYGQDSRNIFRRTIETKVQ